ncbi:MAG TPA: sigma-70 family RNA polymerase sigma factor [Streptosporangiaceae bacterium]|jgi:RNA polymerase sigma-70 factor (ECF subfamily)
MTTTAGTREEAALLARARTGDTAAFEVLVRRYEQPVFRIAIRLLDQPDDAADAAQDAFVTAWRRLRSLRDDRTFAAWLYRITTSRAMNIARAKPRTAGLDAVPHTAVRDTAPGPEQRAIAADLGSALAAALRTLKPAQRACWVLRELEGMSYEEIAAMLDTTPDAVRGRIHRARVHLVEVLDEWR